MSKSFSAEVTKLLRQPLPPGHKLKVRSHGRFRRHLHVVNEYGSKIAFNMTHPTGPWRSAEEMAVKVDEWLLLQTSVAEKKRELAAERTANEGRAKVLREPLWWKLRDALGIPGHKAGDGDFRELVVGGARFTVASTGHVDWEICTYGSASDVETAVANYRDALKRLPQ
jgi:hypothetical protein